MTPNPGGGEGEGESYFSGMLQKDPEAQAATFIEMVMAELKCAKLRGHEDNIRPFLWFRKVK